MVQHIKIDRCSHHTSRMKGEKPHGHLIWCRKSICQNSINFHDKDTKIGREGNFLNIKTVCEKPEVNIIFNYEKLEIFSFKIRTRQGCLLLPLLFNIMQEVLARSISQRIIKGIQTRKEKVKSICRWCDLRCRKLTIPHKKLLE